MTEENLASDEKMPDQAESLRKLMDNNQFKKNAEKLIQWKKEKRIFAFISGKVGLGHSTILSNLAIALTQRTNKSLLIIEVREFHEFDNIRIIYNIIGTNPPVNNFSQVLVNEIPLEKALVKGNYENISMLTWRVNIEGNLKNNTENVVSQEITKNVDRLCNIFDLFIVDVGSVYNPESVKKVAMLPELITIVTPSNTGRKHCYTMLKSLIESSDNNEIQLITNFVTNDKQAQQVNNGMILTVKKFLDTDIQVLGSIPIDINVIEATREHISFVSSFPDTPASVAVNIIAQRLKDPKKNITTMELKNILTKLFTIS